MKGQKRSVIERLMRRLVLDNVLKETITVGFHGMVVSYVKLGKRAQELLSGRMKIVMDVEVSQKRESVVSEPKSNPAVDKVVKCCYDVLIQCRKDIATEKKLATHNILSNDTLHEMSEVRPHTVEQLLNITGVTQLKIDFYGAEFLKRLRNFPPGKPRSTAPPSDFTDSSSSPKWINTNNPPPSNINKTGRGRARKPRKTAASASSSAGSAHFDAYRYKSPSSVAAASKNRAAATSANSNQNVGLMPMPQPKKPKPGSMHRRL